ncbi:MAG: hypothetical protein WDZ52_01705 [Pseudohongiellaceae bacterium]
MKCGNHPAANAIAQCAECAEPLCGICADFSSDAVLCEKCAKNNENSAFVESQSRPKDDFKKILSEPDSEIKEPKKQRLEASIERREKLHMAVVILGCVFIGFRLFTDIGSKRVLNAQEIQQEELAIEQRTLCVQIFWEIGAILQDGREPEPSMRCQETPAINIVTRAGDDLIVRHPNPRALGFSELSVSRSNPTPRVSVL